MSLRRDPSKTRAWQERSKPLEKGAPPERSKPMARKSEMRRVNPERLAARRAVQFGPQAEECRFLPCCCCHPQLYTQDFLALEYRSNVRMSDPHHSPTVANGGTDKDTAPICRKHHDRLDSPGHSEASVEAECGIRFREVAALLHRELRGNLR